MGSVVKKRRKRMAKKKHKKLLKKTRIQRRNKKQLYTGSGQFAIDRCDCVTNFVDICDCAGTCNSGAIC